jgi:hypothetical protein
MAAKAKKVKDCEPAPAEVAKASGTTPAAVASTTAKPVGGLGARLAALSKSQPKAAKGKTPEVRLAGEEVEEAIGTYVQALSDKKDAEAAMADAAAIIIPEAEKNRIDLSRRVKDYQSSLRLNSRLTYVVNTQFCKVKLPDDQEKVEALQRRFGTLFPTYFTVGNAVKVKADALDDALLDALCEACQKVGKEFSDVFETEQVLVVAKALAEDRVMKPEVEVLVKNAETEGELKQYKPTLRE